MESIYYLFGICIFMFIIFYFNELVKLKKEVNKLNGIVMHLLKNQSEKKQKNSK